jgi:hypothetical protein
MTELWSESHAVVTVSEGVFNIRRDPYPLCYAKSHQGVEFGDRATEEEDQGPGAGPLSKGGL